MARQARWLMAWLAAATLAPGAWASEGLNLLGVDTLQVGRADSGTASPRSSYWMLMNPGAITAFESPRIDISTLVVFEKISLNPNGLLGNPFDGELNADSVLPIPAAGTVWPIQCGRGAVAGGLYTIGGGAVQYNESRSILGRLLYHNQDRKNQLQHLRLALAYAYEVGDGWSLGVGLQGSINRLRTNQVTLNLRPAEAGNEWDESYGIGFNVGVYKTIGEHWALGAMFKSRQWSQPIDDYRDLVPESLDYPNTARFGVAWSPGEQKGWTITADYEWQQWSHVPPSGDRVLESGLDWNDLHAYKLGLEWQAIKDRLTLMAGVSYSQSVVEDEHTFINAFEPTIIQAHYTAGATWHINDHHSINLAYLRSAEHSMTQPILGADLIGALAWGSELTVSAHSISLGYSYEF